MTSQTQLEAPSAEDELDAIDEMRLRTWARRHYAPAAERETSWHPVILDEMQQIDSER
jgi:hypothetical protein